MTLTAEQLHRLHYESLTDRRTIERCYAGETVRPLPRARIERAARQLGLEPPPQGRLSDAAALRQLSANARGWVKRSGAHRCIAQPNAWHVEPCGNLKCDAAWRTAK